MAIVMKIKPVKVTAKTQREIMDKVRGYSIWNRGLAGFDRFGTLLMKRGERNDRGIVRLYSLEKHNRKVKVTKRTIMRGKRKGEVEVTREVIRQSGWVAHYYDIPVDMIDTKETRQGTRTFKLKLK